MDIKIEYIALTYGEPFLKAHMSVVFGGILRVTRVRLFERVDGEFAVLLPQLTDLHGKRATLLFPISIPVREHLLTVAVEAYERKLNDSLEDDYNSL